ncbi:hypothetical protein EV368DRAFT_68099 [Lentinula lateritia]|nr:hypothetical protein EV368DRAFT_68099 [Lentinula lateritia]
MPVTSGYELTEIWVEASGEGVRGGSLADFKRLEAQHLIIVQAFEHRLSLAPLKLVAGDQVLESAAGSGTESGPEFSAENHANGIKVDKECIDLSHKQFPPTGTYPSNINNFSVHSIISLPLSWTNLGVNVSQKITPLCKGHLRSLPYSCRIGELRL